MCLLSIEKEIDGFSDLFVGYLSVEIFVYDFGSLLRSDVREKIGAEIPGDGNVIPCPGISR